MTRLIRRLAPAFVAALLVWSPAPAQEPEQAARAVVGTLVADAYTAMAASDLEALKATISEAFAFEIWERFLVGDRDLAPDERETFRQLLPGFLANLYAGHFGKGLEAEPEITGTRTVRRDVLVEARIPRDKGDPLPVSYRVRTVEERGPLVIDVMVAGVSFLLLKRDEFHSLLDAGGAKALLSFMREHAV